MFFFETRICVAPGYDGFFPQNPDKTATFRAQSSKRIQPMAQISDGQASEIHHQNVSHELFLERVAWYVRLGEFVHFFGAWRYCLKTAKRNHPAFN